MTHSRASFPLALALAVLASLSLFSCGKKEEAAPTDQKPQAAARKAGEVDEASLKVFAPLPEVMAWAAARSAPAPVTPVTAG